jgi:hypothetical protein
VLAVTAAFAAADLIDDLLDEFSEKDARAIWEWSGFPGDYPGRAARRVVLRRHALREGWQMARPARSLRRLMRRAVNESDPRAIRLLLLLLTRSAARRVARLRGRAEWLMPRAGHGSTVPVRGSPFGWFALAMPGVPPD